MFGMGSRGKRRNASTYPVPFARRFADGGSLRSIYEKPYGPNSNPPTDIRGNGGHLVIRTMFHNTPAIVLQGNTLTLNSVAGIASTVFFQNTQLVPLFDPNANTTQV